MRLHECRVAMHCDPTFMEAHLKSSSLLTEGGNQIGNDL
jgi:hypothetical protein